MRVSIPFARTCTDPVAAAVCIGLEGFATFPLAIGGPAGDADLIPSRYLFPREMDGRYGMVETVGLPPCLLSWERVWRCCIAADRVCRRSIPGRRDRRRQLRAVGIKHGKVVGLTSNDNHLNRRNR